MFSNFIFPQILCFLLSFLLLAINTSIQKNSGFASFVLQADLVQKFSLKAIQDSFWCNLLLGTQTHH
jgi:hypothetical protein